MPNNLRLQGSDNFKLWRESQDTSIRTRLGGIYYLLAWLLTWGFSSAPASLPVAGGLATAFFAMMLLLRLAHRLPQQDAAAHLQRWIDRHWSLILATCIGWGLIHGWVLSTPEFTPSRLIATLSTVAFSTAMAFNFSMRKARSIVAILLLYLPGLAVLVQDWHQQQAVAVTLAFYLSYLLLAVNRSHREYQMTLEMERQLVDQRETFDRLSRTDSLTQLGNRLQFNHLFPAMVASARRQGTPLTLVLMDIDFFKRINDQYGHDGGDLCLNQFAERMRRVFRRDSDALLRLGGEEFGVLMPGTTLEEACDLAERFRAELAGSEFNLKGQVLPLTTSLGVGSLSAQDATAEAFFRRIDEALYRAKREGRDRLIQASA